MPVIGGVISVARYLDADGNWNDGVEPLARVPP
jgi:hypothetical protein